MSGNTLAWFALPVVAVCMACISWHVCRMIDIPRDGGRGPEFQPEPEPGHPGIDGIDDLDGIGAVDDPLEAELQAIIASFQAALTGVG
ncbi:MAG: hypothetical protein M3083_19960 [Actinomycetota bacterium]|nr:hypothetical protein [Actinomycetota bacterium]MDQ6946307.1 hypothetical protein [Actinomycetota bacterium]